jgi:hypothetical protein
VRRLALVLVLVLVAGSLAACGSGGKKSTTSSGPPVNPSAQIKSAYLKFFSSKTPLAQRVALLQNGAKFKTVVQGFASNPLAKNVTATVSTVTLQGPNNAKVVYTVKLAGAGLPKQTGTAVRQDGTWKVGDASLCKLIALQGSVPAVCKRS